MNGVSQCFPSFIHFIHFYTIISLFCNIIIIIINHEILTNTYLLIDFYYIVTLIYVILLIIHPNNYLYMFLKLTNNNLHLVYLSLINW